MKVKAIKLYEKDSERGCVHIERFYTKEEGLSCHEIMRIQRESDYVNEEFLRKSEDNGRNYSEWERVDRKSYSEFFGTDERMTMETKRVYNPVHKAYQRNWTEGASSYFDHQYLFTATDNVSERKNCRLVKYEEGDDFSRENPRNMAHLANNNGFLNAPCVLSCGDIVVPVGIPIVRACKRLGISTEEIFPSCPELQRGVMLCRGVFDEASEEYRLSFSKPVVISDLASSRGFDEPIVAQLKTGRILLVMRGSNWRHSPWRTRIAEGTRGYKWYAYSDDGGKTFTEAKPWVFDDGSAVFSSATISEFLRSSKNGKLYWVGNVTDKEKTYANFPRYPLHICEVDEERACLKKDTLTVIDTKREGESEKVQLSNFTLMEDRETGDFELGLTKIGQYEGDASFVAETWRYLITLD